MLTASQIIAFIPGLLSLAAKSPCSRDKRGAMVVCDGTILGRGYNSPISGACSDAVCFRARPISAEDMGCAVPDGMCEPRPTRTCSRYVLHAEVKAMCDTVCELAWGDDGPDGGGLFRAGVPLEGCELIHLNTARCHGWHHDHGNGNSEKLPACQYCGGTERVAKPSRRGKACPTCAVQALDLGVSGIWLFHDKLEGDGTEWVRYTMDEYGREAGVL